MNIWQAITWEVARTGGFMAYILLTLSVVVGLALSLHWQSPRWPRLVNNELHTFLTLLSLVFTAIHVLAIWVDPFTHFGWSEVFIPSVSHYRPFWMALGIVGLYLGLAVWISTWLRRWIGYRWWRRFHILTLCLYALVTIHGIATGSDTRAWWGIILYAGSVLMVGTLLLTRLSMPVNTQGRAHPMIVVMILLVLFALTCWAVIGPFQPSYKGDAGSITTNQ
jgi:predicted ferric reductase